MQPSLKEVLDKSVKIIHLIKSRPKNTRLFNNQVEQNAILKALNTLGTIKLSQSVPQTAKILTDRKITLLSLKNPKSKKKKNLIEEIRKQTATLKR
jgi:ribonuclease HI